MRSLAAVCNVVLFGFMILVLVTDGPPEEARSIVFTIWWLLTLAVSAAVISRSGASRILRNAAVVGNIVFLGFLGWTLVDQYFVDGTPHPNEPGFIPLVVLMALTPTLNLGVLVPRRARRV